MPLNDSGSSTRSPAINVWPRVTVNGTLRPSVNSVAATSLPCTRFVGADSVTGIGSSSTTRKLAFAPPPWYAAWLRTVTVTKPSRSSALSATVATL